MNAFTMESLKKSLTHGALAGLVCLAWFGCSDAGDAPTRTRPSPVPAAETLVDCLAKGDFVAATGQFDATMKQALPESKLRDAWQAIVSQAGAFRKTLGTRTEKQPGGETVYVTCEFEQAVLDAKLVFRADGRIQGLWFVPGKRPAPVAASPAVPPATVREEEIKIGEGDWMLAGTLTLPVTAGARAWPGLVLVHGSGPHDRDETVVANKPFRDLAWGLAAKGVAVLRYEKRTKAYPERFLKPGKLTVKEETIEDALRAVARLRATEGIDTNRIFVLGHSLGGTVAPRIAQADPSVAALIILAGSTRPLEDLMVEQTRYLLSLDGDLSSDDQAKLAELQAEVTKVKNVTLTESASAPLFLGAPASYWLDLRQYDAPATAKALKQPMLILQGGRDYQVTDADFEGWKRALASRPDVRFKRYHNLNHLFMAGVGRSTPAEYEQPGHVAAEVIDDIAGWISP